MNTEAALTILSELQRSPESSRRDLVKATGLHVNTVARTVSRLIEKGYVREGEAIRVTGRGRPQIPLAFDTERVCVAGVAIGQGALEFVRTDILGRPLGEASRLEVSEVKALPKQLSSVLNRLMKAAPLAVGVCVTGFVDPDTLRILFSSATPEHEVSLASALKRVGTTPVVLNSELHALSARWLMCHGAARDEDVLVVALEDGAVGASRLVAGHPNRGCVLGGNELGHMRLAVETESCYCGGIGCVERVFSTPFLRRLEGGGRKTLATALGAQALSEGARRIVELTAQAIANAAILTRPHRVVLAGSLSASAGFRDHLEHTWRSGMPAIFRNRIQLEWWPIMATLSAETAAWLAISRVIRGASPLRFCAAGGNGIVGMEASAPTA